MKIITINNQSAQPKYKQIVLSVEMAIAEKRLKREDKLPSVNKVSLEFSISRDTVLLAYDELKKRGIIYSVLGKGYYVKRVAFTLEQRVFLLFDELNAFKEDLYTSFLYHVNKNFQIDIFFHHFNLEMFKKLVEESKGNYSKYIIMPSNLEIPVDLVRSLPLNDTYILDQTNESFKEFPAVYQDFVADMYDALTFGLDKVKKYTELILIFPGEKEPTGMVSGFLKFCVENNNKHSVISSFEDNEIQKGSLFIIPNDRHLVNVIEQAKRQGFILGVDYGIISYNDTSLKKVVENGITTISTDFNAMGKTLAQMINTNSKSSIKNISRLIMRNSL
ncbi:GntR family transcriptional regulator [Flavobacterium sedimenticola]|uniref:GntR family transcriptional regulator n=1 Tax=Flavobacterium sedimenticola TaxID=3043286 RepID=A0ABT6XRW9_9FLAO|nr:GntR family transcriptional regulator [Flavobacterium sedimenticola]MDI9257832.1 GntR family transcriptional regulator [Flavobacterium sedimenticola]